MISEHSMKESGQNELGFENKSNPDCVYFAYMYAPIDMQW